MHAAALIQRKRDGEELAPEELSGLVLAYVRDEVPDYQIAAFCMAVFFRGLSPGETFALTEAMVASGTTLDLRSALGRGAVDKHSTGGVGDKASLVVGPIVAACGVPFAKMAGRGLGHTVGTIDKLEAIPGFRTELSTDEFVAQVRGVGLAIVSASADLVPADRRLYALRDVTATVDQPSLIAASVMSKKIAAGADAIVLDVKVGGGAFVRDLASARELATTMVAIGGRAGRRVACLLTAMEQPLGHAVGNALEVREALATLRGEGPADFTELVLATSGCLLSLSDLALDEPTARASAERALADGTALAQYERWVGAQGGDPRESELPRAPVVADVEAQGDAFVQALDAQAIGLAALRLGAGRLVKEAAVDHAVGVVCVKKTGDAVTAGEPLAAVHARDEAALERAVAEVRAAYRLGADPVPVPPIVLDVVS